MSMILDALSRAEKERQAESRADPDMTRYVTQSHVKDERLKKWVLIVLVANLGLLIVLLTAYVFNNYLATTRPGESIMRDKNGSQPVAGNATDIDHPLSVLQAGTALSTTEKTSREKGIDSSQRSVQPASMASLEREAQINTDKSGKREQQGKTAVPVKNTPSVSKIPPVRYSDKPLTESTGVTGKSNNQPTVASIAKAIKQEKQITARDYAALNDLPVSQRSLLDQYEINVHVYDSNPASRFVLINMVKYKEGDRISEGEAVVDSIVPEGVVVNIGSQRVLMHRN